MSERNRLQVLIEEELQKSKEANPRGIARRVLDRLEDSELRDALEHCLHHEVREVIRRDRMTVTRELSTMRTGSARWRAVARELMQSRHYAGVHGWVVLGDATPEQVEEIQVQYWKRAAEAEAWAKRFGTLYATMHAEGVTKVSELGESKVAEIWAKNPLQRGRRIA